MNRELSKKGSKDVPIKISDDIVSGLMLKKIRHMSNLALEESAIHSSSENGSSSSDSDNNSANI